MQSYLINKDARFNFIRRFITGEYKCPFISYQSIIKVLNCKQDENADLISMGDSNTLSLYCQIDSEYDNTILIEIKRGIEYRSRYTIVSNQSLTDSGYDLIIYRRGFNQQVIQLFIGKDPIYEFINKINDPRIITKNYNSDAYLYSNEIVERELKYKIVDFITIKLQKMSDFIIDKLKFMKNGYRIYIGRLLLTKKIALYILNYLAQYNNDTLIQNSYITHYPNQSSVSRVDISRFENDTRNASIVGFRLNIRKYLIMLIAVEIRNQRVVKLNNLSKYIDYLNLVYLHPTSVFVEHLANKFGNMDIVEDEEGTHIHFINNKNKLIKLKLIK